MIVDSSAILAILNQESDHERLLELLHSNPCRMSVATHLETAIVVDARREAVLSRRLDDLVALTPIELVSFTAAHGAIARAAYRDYGRGSGHPARLNFGDCFAYALARDTGEPLLFVGEDFTHTDVIAAT